MKPDERLKLLTVTFDEGDENFHVQGLGFDFHLYLTGDFAPDSEQFLEFDHVKRAEETFVLHMQIPIDRPADQLSVEWLKIQVFNRLHQHWYL